MSFRRIVNASSKRRRRNASPTPCLACLQKNFLTSPFLPGDSSPTRCERVADATPTRPMPRRPDADATMAYRRYDSDALLTRRERVTYSTRRRRVADATPTRRERADDAMPTRREYLVRIGIIISRDNV